MRTGVENIRTFLPASESFQKTVATLKKLVALRAERLQPRQAA
jgi:hypothetical protein